MELKERLKIARARENLTIEGLANRIGINKASYAQYESSRAQMPSLERAAEIAKALNVSLDFLGGLTNDPTPKWKTDKTDPPALSTEERLAKIEAALAAAGLLKK